MNWEDPTNWQEFRAVYAADSPGLDRVADAFESAGFEFLSYGDLWFKGRQICVLRVSDGLYRYGIFGAKDLPVGLCRFTKSGKMVPLPVPLPRRNKNTWNSVVAAIRRSSAKLN